MRPGRHQRIRGRDIGTDMGLGVTVRAGHHLILGDWDMAMGTG